MPLKQIYSTAPSTLSDNEAFRRFNKHLEALTDKVKRGQINNFSDFCFLLSIGGVPMQMDDFYFFRDMFSVMPCKREVWKTGRQTSKTHSSNGSNILERTFRPETKSLTVTPLFSQIKRISTDVVYPMMRDSIWSNCFFTPNSKQSILQRQYANRSVDYYSYAGLDAKRIRSISGIDRLNLDEVQDMLTDVLPIIEQTQVARPRTGWKRYTGTPLSMGNLLQKLWNESSQAEECVRCAHCSRWNIGAIDQHLEKMIGKETCVCAFCGRPLDVYAKVFVPRYPDREDFFLGRHISQVMHPLHACIPSQWKELLRSLNSSEWTKARIYNELFGESFDSAERMIDLPTLQMASCLGPNTLAEALHRRNDLAITAMGIDWGGGGDNNSLTKIVLGGLLRGSSKVVCHFLYCLPQSLPPQAQVAEILGLIEKYQPMCIAHDYTGGGWLFETLGLERHVRPNQLYPFTYAYSPSSEVIHKRDDIIGARSSLVLDRTRSLLILYTQLKAGNLLLPDWESQLDRITGKRPADDFMHMFLEAKPRPVGSDLLYVKTDPGESDDIVHAVNLMASACWYTSGSYPSTNSLIQPESSLILTEEEVRDTDPLMLHETPDWSDAESGWMREAKDDGPVFV